MSGRYLDIVHFRDYIIHDLFRGGSIGPCRCMILAYMLQCTHVGGGRGGSGEFASMIPSLGIILINHLPGDKGISIRRKGPSAVPRTMTFLAHQRESRKQSLALLASDPRITWRTPLLLGFEDLSGEGLFKKKKHLVSGKDSERNISQTTAGLVVRRMRHRGPGHRLFFFLLDIPL